MRIGYIRKQAEQSKLNSSTSSIAKAEMPINIVTSDDNQEDYGLADLFG